MGGFIIVFGYLYYMKTTMKFSDLIDKPVRKKVMIITEQQFRFLASKVVSLMEQDEIIQTYLIKSKSNGK